MGSRGVCNPGSYYGARTRTSLAWGLQSYSIRGHAASGTPARLETGVRTIPVRTKTGNQTASTVAWRVNVTPLPILRLRQSSRPTHGGWTDHVQPLRLLTYRMDVT